MVAGLLTRRDGDAQIISTADHHSSPVGTPTPDQFDPAAVTRLLRQHSARAGAGCSGELPGPERPVGMSEGPGGGPQGPRVLAPSRIDADNAGHGGSRQSERANATRRRSERFRQLALLWEVSTLRRVRLCGKAALPEQIRTVKLTHDGVAHYAGVQRCGSIWACPVCAAKIRAHRADELSEMAERHMANGGSIWMVTLTARHHWGIKLADMFRAMNGAWRNLVGTRLWTGDPRRGAIGERQELGVIGYVRASEITLGRNGWHLHYHVLLFLEREPDAAVLGGVMRRWNASWKRYLAKRGMEPVDGIGIQWDRCERVKDAAAYIVKVAEATWSVGNEVARGDLKAGRLGSLNPFDILTYFRMTGDADALDLWREYEAATKGHLQLVWSRGLRARLLGEDREEALSDEEVAALEVGGEAVAQFDDDAWRVVVMVPGMYARVLETVEAAGDVANGYWALAELLAPYGVRPTPPE